MQLSYATILHSPIKLTITKQCKIWKSGLNMDSFVKDSDICYPVTGDFVYRKSRTHPPIDV